MHEIDFPDPISDLRMTSLQKEIYEFKLLQRIEDFSRSNKETKEFIDGLEAELNFLIARKTKIFSRS